MYPTRSCRSAHQGQVGHFVVDILVGLGLGPGCAPVHVGGQFAPLGRGHAHRRGRARGRGQAGPGDSSEGLRCSRAVAGHVDSLLVHHSVIPRCSVITALSDKNCLKRCKNRATNSKPSLLYGGYGWVRNQLSVRFSLAWYRAILTHISHSESPTFFCRVTHCKGFLMINLSIGQDRFVF